MLATIFNGDILCVSHIFVGKICRDIDKLEVILCIIFFFLNCLEFLSLKDFSYHI